VTFIITQGLVSVDENFTHLILIYKATPAQILFRLRLPNALPIPLNRIRISAGIRVIGGIVIGGITGELFDGSMRVGKGGRGDAIIYASSQMETAYLFALVVAATSLGFSLFSIVMFFQWLTLHNWQESNRSQAAE
jgi:NitT/TauT family transport system permease protein